MDPALVDLLQQGLDSALRDLSRSGTVGIRRHVALTAIHWSHYRRGDAAGLDAAIAVQNGILSIRNRQSPEFLVDLDIAVGLLRERYEVRGDSHVEDVEDACTLAATAIKCASGEERADRIVTLADLHEVRPPGKATRTVDYDRVVELREQALSLVPPASMLVVSRMAELVASLVAALRAGHALRLLDRALEVSERLVEVVGPAERGEALKTLFDVLRLRGSVADIERTVRIAAKGVAVEPESADWRCDLAVALSLRRASIGDLDEAIALVDSALRMAATTTPFTVTTRRKAFLAKLRAERFRMHLLTFTRFASLPLRSYAVAV